MTIDTQTIDRLTARLTSADDPSPLTEEERSLLSAALTQLAASQAIIAGQDRLLQLHGEMKSQIDSIAQSALSSLSTQLQGPSPLDAYDADAAQAARRQLLAEIESANTSRASLAAVFRFVRAFGGLAG